MDHVSPRSHGQFCTAASATSTLCTSSCPNPESPDFISLFASWHSFISIDCRTRNGKSYVFVEQTSEWTAPNKAVECSFNEKPNEMKSKEMSSKVSARVGAPLHCMGNELRQHEFVSAVRIATRTINIFVLSITSRWPKIPTKMAKLKGNSLFVVLVCGRFYNKHDRSALCGSVATPPQSEFTVIYCAMRHGNFERSPSLFSSSLLLLILLRSKCCEMTNAAASSPNTEEGNEQKKMLRAQNVWK